jgi:hypothetical protein
MKQEIGTRKRFGGRYVQRNAALKSGALHPLAVPAAVTATLKAGDNTTTYRYDGQGVERDVCSSSTGQAGA